MHPFYVFTFCSGFCIVNSLISFFVFKETKNLTKHEIKCLYKWENFDRLTQNSFGHSEPLMVNQIGSFSEVSYESFKSDK